MADADLAERVALREVGDEIELIGRRSPGTTADRLQ